jgi:poly(3-hydroxybutyrate) depolymerase
MRRHDFLNAFSAALLALAVTAAPAAADPLPKLSIDPNAVSLSGLSSGAFMVSQLQVAYSASFMGAAVVAGGPYYCAMDNIAYTSICMGQVPFMPPNPAVMYASAQGFAAAGQIDPLDNLKTKPIYIYTGTQDTVVKSNAVQATKGFYQLAGVPDSKIKYVNTVPSGHAFISPIYGGACAANETPYINECNVNKKLYDQAGDLLQHIYGNLNAPVATPGGRTIAFEQATYDPNPLVSSLSDLGHAYIPAACDAAGANCRLHVSIHGCGQDEKQIGDDWYTDLYLNNWADTNKTVVLYPQVSASLANPAGCWDWWGYTGLNYAIKGGVQMTAINNMIAALSGK